MCDRNAESSDFVLSSLFHVRPSITKHKECASHAVSVISKRRIIYLIEINIIAVLKKSDRVSSLDNVDFLGIKDVIRILSFALQHVACMTN